MLCSNDLSQGVRSSAAAVTAAEQGMRQGAQYLNLAVKESVIPSVRSKVPAAKGTKHQLKLLQQTPAANLLLPSLGLHRPCLNVWNVCL